MITTMGEKNIAIAAAKPAEGRISLWSLGNGGEKLRTTAPANSSGAGAQCDQGELPLEEPSVVSQTATVNGFCCRQQREREHKLKRVHSRGISSSVKMSYLLVFQSGQEF